MTRTKKIVISSAAILAGFIAIGAASDSGSKHVAIATVPTTAASGSSTPVSSPSAVSAAPEVVVSTLTAEPTPTPKPTPVPTPDVTPQYVQSMLASTTQMSQDMSAMGTDCGALQVQACHDDAVTVHGDAQRWIASFSIAGSVPDRFLHVNGVYVKALQFLSDGAEDEAQGIDAMNIDQMQNGVDLTQEGDTYLGQASTEMQSLCGGNC